jgi:hypothetical protein
MDGSGSSTGQRLLALPRRSRHEKAMRALLLIFFSFDFFSAFPSRLPKRVHVNEQYGRGIGSDVVGGLVGWVGRCGVHRATYSEFGFGCPCLSFFPLLSDSNPESVSSHCKILLWSEAFSL